MIEYIIGDCLNPVGYGQKFIVHCCNNIGAWGAGFTGALDKRFPEAARLFRTCKMQGLQSTLGDVQYCPTNSPNIYIINLIGQNGIISAMNPMPVRYEAIHIGFLKIVERLKSIRDTVPKPSIHMPRMGCGLAGGKWSEIEKKVQDTFIRDDIPVFVYDLNATEQAKYV